MLASFALHQTAERIIIFVSSRNQGRTGRCFLLLNPYDRSGPCGVKLGQGVSSPSCQVLPHPCPAVSAGHLFVRLPYVMQNLRPSVNVSGCILPDQYHNHPPQHRHYPRRQSLPEHLQRDSPSTHACTENYGLDHLPREIAQILDLPTKLRIVATIVPAEDGTWPTFCEDGGMRRELQHLRRNFRDLPEPQRHPIHCLAIALNARRNDARSPRSPQVLQSCGGLTLA